MFTQARMLIFCSLFLFNHTIVKASSEDPYFNIEKVSVREKPVSVETFMEVHAMMDIKPSLPSIPTLPTKPGGATEIINLGLKIWKIIEDNRPVVNLNLSRASALPSDLKDWTQMERWSDIQVREYEVSYINGFKAEVVKLNVLLTYVYGGKFNGAGEYLSQVGVLIKDLEVSWGFKVNADTEVARIVNIGTRDNPAALMEMNLKWSISSVMKHIQEGIHFNIKGNGEVVAY